MEFTTIKDIIIGLGLPTGLLLLILYYVVFPISKKYMDFVDKAIENLDTISISQGKCAEAQNQILDELKRIKGVQ